MKAKKIILAIAIFGGVLFTAQAAVQDANENPTSQVDKGKKPNNG